MIIDIQTTRDDHRIAWLTALAVSIHLLESIIPNPVPGLKPGFANIVTIIVLCQFGLGMAAWVNLLRVLVSSLLLGTFLSPTFMLSLSGAISSIAILALAYQLDKTRMKFGPMGYSLLAAMAHITGQFVLAYLLFIPHPGIWTLFPVLFLFAILLGTVNGIISQNILKRIQ
jgi:heptaprenyl diphosphate synthase